MYDTIIIGAGPAGMTAGIYASRGGLKALIIEKIFYGGQASLTFEIENYPGFEKIGGVELMTSFFNQCEKHGVEFEYDEISKMELAKEIKTITLTSGKMVEGKTVIFAQGAKAKKLGVKGEEEFSGRGVSYCATCDGNFYRDKVVAVVGGGNTALGDALYLAKIAKKVFLIHRRDQLRGSKVLQDKIFASSKIEFLKSSEIAEIAGDAKVQSITLKSGDKISVDGVFMAVGYIPQTENLPKIDKNKQGYVLTNERMETNLTGVYACGDLREKPLRQVVTACSDGAIAANSAIEFLL